VHKLENIFIFSLLIFSLWIAFYTFGYDSETNTIMISRLVHSDFASHIPLIRSFSQGDNFPVEFPLFPGEPIRYHYVFYLFVGLLEKIGIRIDYALNLPSAFGMFLLLTMIYKFGAKFFNDKRVGVLGVIFFVFNGTLSWLKHFENQGKSIKSFISSIPGLREYPCFGPWSGDLVSAFWNLNIYINQRHFALAIGIFLLFLYQYLFLLKNYPYKKQIQVSVVWAIILGAFPLFHQPALMIFAIYLIYLFFTQKNTRVPVFITGALSFLLITIVLFKLTSSSKTAANIIFKPGYLAFEKLTIMSFIKYWFYNLGINVVFLPISLFYVKKEHKIFLVSLFALFLIPNLFQFSMEMAGNHKFFNFMIIFVNFYSAVVILKLFDKKNKIVKYGLTFLAILFMTLSGIIDFNILRNAKASSSFSQTSKDVSTWIRENTKKKSLFLNNSLVFHPASVAGRSIYYGWPYFAWSAGYDTHKRGRTFAKMINEKDYNIKCKLMKANKIDYFTIESNDGKDGYRKLDLNEYLNIAVPAFNIKDEYLIYSVSEFCKAYE
jgi:hypothetical protein